MMKPTSKPPLAQPDGYSDWLAQLKGEIAQARQRAALAVNAELVQLYRRIGHDILLRQHTQGRGAKVVDRLARDLKDSFPDMRGWSSSNLKYMRFFAQHCPDGQFGQQPADQLPWFHIVTLLTRLDTAAEREWYAVQTVQHGWSRATLALPIRNVLGWLAELGCTLRYCKHVVPTAIHVAVPAGRIGERTELGTSRPAYTEIVARHAPVGRGMSCNDPYSETRHHLTRRKSWLHP